MADRTYTTKSRAKRIALDYFKRPHPLRRAKLVLSLALPLLGALAIAAYALRGDHRLYNSGPVSTAHTMFGARCEHCHTASPLTAAGAAPKSTFFVPVSKQTCTVCHEGPIHHDTQAFEPACTSCHFEHKGRVHLVDFGDRQCTQCHAGLTTKEGRSAFEPRITGLQARHPEFSVTLVRGTKTEGRVKLDDKALQDTGESCLNHETHLKSNRFPRDATWYHDRPGVIDSKKDPRLGCTYCHAADAQRAYMTAVKYDTHCADCHPLEFDAANYPGVKAPHDKPEIVRAFLRKTYADSPPKPAAKAPAPSEEPTTRRRLKGRDDEPAEGPKPGGGFKDAAAAEAGLFFDVTGNTCLYCHALAVPGDVETRASCSQSKNARARAAEAVRAALGGKLPEVVATNMQARWLPHSRFSHRAHRPFACVACHDKVKASTATADVLMPGIATCQQCHRDGTGARAACVECHTYHDKAREGSLDGRLGIDARARGDSP